MKKMLMILAAVLATFAIAEETAPAAPTTGATQKSERPARPGNRPQGPRRQMDKTRMLQMAARAYDANHNGKLDPEERAQMVADLDKVGNLAPQRPPRREGKGGGRGGRPQGQQRPPKPAAEGQE